MMRFTPNTMICAAVTLLIAGQAIAQPLSSSKGIQVEDIWAKKDFFADYFPGFQWHNNGNQYLEETEDGLAVYDTRTGKKTGMLVPKELLTYEGKALEADGFEVLAGGKKVLISTKTKPIYRRSVSSEFYVLDLDSKKVLKLDDGAAPEQNATIAPDGSRAAYMRENNVFVTDLATGKITQVTKDGEVNKIINGACDWVYEEEFEFAQAMYWSPDSKRLAFYRFDEAQVPEYNLQYWKGLYPKDYRYKYPKAGEKNSDVSVKIYEAGTGQTVQAKAGAGDQYIARVKWSTNPSILSLIRLNRLQNKYELLHCQAASGECTAVYTETSPAYVEVTNNLEYLPGGKGFVNTSEKDGWRHLYLFGMDGKMQKRLTQGNWEIEKVHGVSAKGVVYFTANMRNATQKELYSVTLSGGMPRLMTPEVGTHDIEFAEGLGFYIDTYSTLNTAPRQTLYSVDGKIVKLLKDNKALNDRMTSMGLSKAELIQVKVSDSLSLNGWTIKPPRMEAGRKYPVLMFCYGGPGNQTVTDDFHGPDYFWYQMLAQQGYIIVSVDNRGTGGRGSKFKKATYGKMGRLESDDQAATARYLQTLPYVDAQRVGIWGWSFGGYLTGLTLARYPELFKAGISVAPVTNWRFYDSIYTERYLGLPSDNAAGYDENSPAKLADRIKAKYLLVHGTGDDNVHVQNSMEMTNALVAANIPFEEMFYPDRHHGISGGKTRLHLYNKMTEFLNRNL